MKVIVKSHKRNGRVVKSHMRKAQKTKAKGSLKKNYHKWDYDSENGIDGDYKSALEKHPETGKLRAAIMDSTKNFKKSHNDFGRKNRSFKKKAY